MKYQEFIVEICEKVKAHLPDYLKGAVPEIVSIRMNNNTEVNAVAIRNGDASVTCRVSLQKCYEAYQYGEDLEEIAEDIVNMHVSLTRMRMGDMPFNFMDYNQVREHLVVQIICKDMNSDMLEQMPHKALDHTNLAVVYRGYLKTGASFPVTNTMLGYWNVTAETLHQDALANTVRTDPLQVLTLKAEVLRKMGISDVECRGADMKMEPEEFYVLRNTSGRWGAAALLYPGVLQQLAETSQANFFVLPSTVHEVLVLVDSEEIDARKLQALVIDVNQQEVLAEDVLSNDIYYYDKDENMLSMAVSRDYTEEQMSVLEPEEIFDITFGIEDYLER